MSNNSDTYDPMYMLSNDLLTNLNFPESKIFIWSCFLTILSTMDLQANSRMASLNIEPSYRIPHFKQSVFKMVSC